MHTVDPLALDDWLEDMHWLLLLIGACLVLY
jgi:hypothetical protein